MNVTTDTWPRPHRHTVDEYYRMAEVGVLSPESRVELIDGEIVDMAPIGSRHAAAVSLLTERLIRAVGDLAIVWIQSPVRLDAFSEPQPDLALLRRRAGRYADAHPRPTDVLLLIEVSDATLRYDREVKARLYARRGIPELWIVDLPNRQLLMQQHPGAGGYAEEAAVEGRAVRIESLGIEVDLTDLF